MGSTDTSALTDAEKAAIRDYLGYADVTTRPFFILEGHMTALSTAARPRVRDLLTSIAALDAQRDAIVNRAGVTQAGSVGLDVGDGYRVLRSERRHRISQLGRLLGVTPREEVPGDGARSGFTERI